MAAEELFHAYVVGGARANARAHIESLLAPFDIIKPGNPDYMVTEHVAFTIDDARNLRAWQTMTSSSGGKKVFVVYTDFINDQAQDALLKTLEEPVEGTHIIFAVPKPETLLPTLLSRVRIVISKEMSGEEVFAEKEIKSFLNMNVADRIAFVGKMAEKGDDDDASAQVREKALAFIDALEKYLSARLLDTTQMSDRNKLEGILKLKRYLFTSGASVKMILEHLAITL